MRDRTTLHNEGRQSGVRILAATLALFLALPALARADGEKAFNIQRQVLSSALHEFARQSDRQILFSTDIVVSKQTAGVRGDLQPEAALQELLKGTGLTFRITTDNTILIEQPKAVKTGDTTKNIGKDGSGDSFRLAQATDKSTAGDSSAASQDGEQRSDKSPLQEVIITGQNSRLSSNVDGFPGSVTVVGKEEVQTQLAISTDVGQLLKCQGSVVLQPKFDVFVGCKL